MSVLWVILTAFVLVLYWAWLYLTITLDRGQVDKERMILTDGTLTGTAVMYVGPETRKTLGKEGKLELKRAPAGESIYAQPLLFNGIPIVVSDMLKSRTRW